MVEVAAAGPEYVTIRSLLPFQRSATLPADDSAREGVSALKCPRLHGGFERRYKSRCRLEDLRADNRLVVIQYFVLGELSLVFMPVEGIVRKTFLEDGSPNVGRVQQDILNRSD